MGDSEYYNNLCPYFFPPVILQPTRLIERSKTLTDNLFFNSFTHCS